jgi:hypothetical protein
MKFNEMPAPIENEDAQKKGNNLSKKAGSWLKGAVAATALFMHPGAPDAESAPETETKYSEQEMGEKTTTYDLYHTFFRKDPSGNYYFNAGTLLSSLITPLEVVRSIESNARSMAEIAIPYEYARLYNTARTLDPEAAKKVEEYIKEELVKQLGENVYKLGPNFLTDGVIEANRPLDVNFSKIRSVSITGLASPEGSTPDSIVPGTVELKNMNLAEKRARDAAAMLPSDISTEVMENVMLTPKEVQFTDQELTDMDKASRKFMAEKYSDESMLEFLTGGTEYNYAAIFEMIQAHNKGIYNEPLLDEILNSKRSAIIQLEGEHGKKDTTVIPLPLSPLLLLGLIPLLWRKRPTPIPVPTPKPLPEIIPEPLPFSNIPENPASGEYWRARYHTLRDLYEGFDSQRHIDQGINYRSICADLEALNEQFATDEDRITWVSHRVLDQWIDCDAQKLNIDRSKLNYKNDPHQLMYARLHAEEILEAVEDHMRERGGTGNDDYTLTIWGNYIEAYNEVAEAVIHPEQ